MRSSGVAVSVTGVSTVAALALRGDELAFLVDCAAQRLKAANAQEVMLGYSDLNNGTAALENGGGSVPAHDANFVVFDNVLVETISQTRQKWNFNGGGSWSEGAKWDNGEPNAVTHVADHPDDLTRWFLEFRTDRSPNHSAGLYIVHRPRTPCG